MQPNHQGLQQKKISSTRPTASSIELPIHLVRKCKEVKRETNPLLGSAKKDWGCQQIGNDNVTFEAHRHNFFGTTILKSHGSPHPRRPSCASASLQQLRWPALRDTAYVMVMIMISCWWKTNDATWYLNNTQRIIPIMLRIRFHPSQCSTASLAWIGVSQLPSPKAFTIPHEGHKIITKWPCFSSPKCCTPDHQQTQFSISGSGNQVHRPENKSENNRKQPLLLIKSTPETSWNNNWHFWWGHFLGHMDFAEQNICLLWCP